MAQSEGEAPEEKFQTQVPRQGLQAVVYSRMKSLPASAQGAVLSRLPSLPSASGIGHGRLRELLAKSSSSQRSASRARSHGRTASPSATVSALALYG